MSKARKLLHTRYRVNDLERTAMLVDPKTSESKSLIWKYHVSVKNELQKRSEKRLAEVLEQTQKQ